VLVELLGKPICESSALFIPTAIYPFPGSAGMAWQAICGKAESPLCELGWKSLGLLELTALPSISERVWVPMVEKTDVLLVWGGDPVYLSHWMRKSGLADLLPSLRQESVYVGVSAGSMAVASIFGETYGNPRSASGGALTSDDIRFATPKGEISVTFITAKGAGLVDFALIPHLDHEDHPAASMANAEKWARKLTVPVYAIDDQTAIKVVDDTVEVVSEGHWKLFTP
jgi:dipeptidase E